MVMSCYLIYWSWVCTFVWGSTHMYLCVHVYGGQRTTSGVSSQVHHTLWGEWGGWGLTLVWNSPVHQTGQPVESRVLSCSHSSFIGIINHTNVFSYLIQVLKIKLRSSGLHGKYFTDSAPCWFLIKSDKIPAAIWVGLNQKALMS